MPELKRAKPATDDRLLFAMYDSERATQSLEESVECLTDQVEQLREGIEGLTTIIEDLIEKLNAKKGK